MSETERERGREKGREGERENIFIRTFLFHQCVCVCRERERERGSARARARDRVTERQRDFRKRYLIRASAAARLVSAMTCLSSACLCCGRGKGVPVVNLICSAANGLLVSAMTCSSSVYLCFGGSIKALLSLY